MYSGLWEPQSRVRRMCMRSLRDWLTEQSTRTKAHRSSVSHWGCSPPWMHRSRAVVLFRVRSRRLEAACISRRQAWSWSETGGCLSWIRWARRRWDSSIISRERCHSPSMVRRGSFSSRASREEPGPFSYRQDLSLFTLQISFW